MRNHPTTITAIQSPKQKKCRAEEKTLRNQIKAYKNQIKNNSGITIRDDSPLLTWLPRHTAWQYTRFYKRQDSITAYEKIRHMPHQSPILCVGEAVAGRQSGALCSRFDSAWCKGIWFGRDSKTDEHLIGTPNGMFRCRALKRRVKRRLWDVDLLNAMILDPWSPIPVTKGKTKPCKANSDSEPILTTTIPRAPTPQMMLGTTVTQSSTEKVCIQSCGTEAEGAHCPLHKTKTTKAEKTSQTITTSSARMLVEQIGNEAGKDSQSTQIRRTAPLATECESFPHQVILLKPDRCTWKNSRKT